MPGVGCDEVVKFGVWVGEMKSFSRVDSHKSDRDLFNYLFFFFFVLV